MTTKASTTKKRSRTKVAAKKEVNGKKSKALQIQNLPLGKIKPDLEQPRKTFNEDALKQLSESIKKHGVLQPITVRQLNGHYIIVMGERRYRASKLAGKRPYPASSKLMRTMMFWKFRLSRICKDRMSNRPKKLRRLLT